MSLDSAPLFSVLLCYRGCSELLMKTLCLFWLCYLLLCCLSGIAVKCRKPFHDDNRLILARRRRWIRVEPQPPAFKPLLIRKPAVNVSDCTFECVERGKHYFWAEDYFPHYYFFMFLALTIHSGLSKQNRMNCGKTEVVLVCIEEIYLS